LFTSVSINSNKDLPDLIETEANKSKTDVPPFGTRLVHQNEEADPAGDFKMSPLEDRHLLLHEDEVLGVLN